MEIIPGTHKKKIRERGVLKVGTTGDYPPLSFPDPVTGPKDRKICWRMRMHFGGSDA